MLDLLFLKLKKTIASLFKKIRFKKLKKFLSKALTNNLRFDKLKA